MTVVDVNGMELCFEAGFSHVLSHIKSSNPHPRGSTRDALTFGVTPSKYLWTPSTHVISIDDILEPDPCSLDFWVYAGRILSGSLPPAIILEMFSEGKYCVLDGNHRLTAIQKSGLKSATAYVGVLKGSPLAKRMSPGKGA